MGGPATCTFVVQGNTAEEMAKAGGAHVMTTHPDIAEKMKAMTPEENASWMANFQTQFDAMPDMA